MAVMQRHTDIETWVDGQLVPAAKQQQPAHVQREASSYGLYVGPMVKLTPT
jgi:hypothetical protein